MGPGKPHNCNKMTQQDNLENILKSNSKQNKNMIDFFTSKEQTFQSKVMGKVEEVMRPVILADLPALITFLLQEQNMDPDNHKITFGLDDGQGILKIMMFIKDKPAGAEPPHQQA